MKLKCLIVCAVILLTGCATDQHGATNTQSGYQDNSSSFQPTYQGAEKASKIIAPITH